MFCHCRSDKAGHPHEAFPRFSGVWKKDPKTGKEVQELIAACPARKKEGKGAMFQPKLLKAAAKARRRMSADLLEHKENAASPHYPECPFSLSAGAEHDCVCDEIRENMEKMKGLVIK